MEDSNEYGATDGLIRRAGHIVDSPGCYRLRMPSPAKVVKKTLDR